MKKILLPLILLLFYTNIVLATAVTDERWKDADCLFDVPKGSVLGKDIICARVIVCFLQCLFDPSCNLILTPPKKPSVIYNVSYKTPGSYFTATFLSKGQ